MDLIGFIPSFGGLLQTVVAFVVALSIIVAVHEYGHYIVGRWTGIHAEVFSLGFGPVLASRVDRHGTRWQIAAIPFGGFVKFLGDADAASGKDGAAISALSPAERRRTMHGAPIWARSATVAAGPVFNFILSVLIFAGIYLFTGVSTNEPLVNSLRPLPFASASLLPGDRIVALNGTPTPDMETFGAALDALPAAPSITYEVDRAGQIFTLTGPHPFVPVVDQVQPQSAAAEADIRVDDVVTAVNGVAVNTFTELRDTVGASDGKPVTLAIWRDGATFDVTLTPKRMDLPTAGGGFETRWLIGLTGGLAFEPETRTPGPVELLTLGAEQTWGLAQTSLSGLWHMVSGQISACNLQGPLGIAETSGAAASAGLLTFVWFVAMLSTGVGLINLFPIPVLDGGHLVFHAWEAVTGKPPTDRVLQGLMATGLACLLALMVFATTNDLFCP